MSDTPSLDKISSLESQLKELQSNYDDRMRWYYELQEKLKEVEGERNELKDKIENYECPRFIGINKQLKSERDEFETLWKCCRFNLDHSIKDFDRLKQERDSMMKDFKTVAEALESISEGHGHQHANCFICKAVQIAQRILNEQQKEKE